MNGWQWPLFGMTLGSGVTLLIMGKLLEKRPKRFLPHEALAERTRYIQPGKREAVEGDF